MPKAAETNAINEILSDDSLIKRDKAICLLLQETGLRAIDVYNDIEYPTSEILWQCNRRLHTRLNNHPCKW